MAVRCGQKRHHPPRECDPPTLAMQCASPPPRGSARPYCCTNSRHDAAHEHQQGASSAVPSPHTCSPTAASPPAPPSACTNHKEEPQTRSMHPLAEQCSGQRSPQPPHVSTPHRLLMCPAACSRTTRADTTRAGGSTDTQTHRGVYVCACAGLCVARERHPTRCSVACHCCRAEQLLAVPTF